MVRRAQGAAGAPAGSAGKPAPGWFPDSAQLHALSVEVAAWARIVAPFNGGPPTPPPAPAPPSLAAQAHRLLASAGAWARRGLHTRRPAAPQPPPRPASYPLFLLDNMAGWARSFATAARTFLPPAHLPPPPATQPPAHAAARAQLHRLVAWVSSFTMTSPSSPAPAHASPLVAPQPPGRAAALAQLLHHHLGRAAAWACSFPVFARSPPPSAPQRLRPHSPEVACPSVEGLVCLCMCVTLSHSTCTS